MSASGHPADLDEATLLADCDLQRTKRSGPGGQHRNKVASAVVITHRPTGVRVEAAERRSQHENRRRALFRLRVRLAVEVRRPVEKDFTPSELWRSRRGGRIAINPRHHDFPAVLAEAMDVVAACGWDVRPAAEMLGTTASQLVRLLGLERAALATVNGERKALNLRPLR